MGSLADWVGGVGSAAAAATAVGVLLHERGLRKKQEAAEHQREQQSQASKVTWWLEKPDTSPDAGVPRPFVDGAEQWTDYGQHHLERLFILNSSGDCLYEVTVQLPDAFWDDREDGLPLNFTPHLVRQVGTLPPGGHMFEIPVASPMTPTQGDRRKAATAFNQHVRWVEFRDRNDILWRRLGDGSLEEQPQRPAETNSFHSV